MMNLNGTFSLNLANWIFLFLFYNDKEFSVQSFVLPFTHIIFHLDFMIDIFLLFRFEIILFAIKVIMHTKEEN